MRHRLNCRHRQKANYLLSFQSKRSGHPKHSVKSTKGKPGGRSGRAVIAARRTASLYPNKLNVSIVYSPGLITLNFLVCMMIEILLIGCFLRHTMQSNLLCFNVSSLKCVVLISFCPFLHCEIDAFCHHFNKAFRYVCSLVLALLSPGTHCFYRTY